MNVQKEFNHFATKKMNVNSLALSDYTKFVSNSKLQTPITAIKSSMTPNIIEERQMNVVAMDVFSRLMMDRIIFLGTAIDDMISNVIIAQLLFLDSVDSKKEIQLYLNTPGGEVDSGLAIVDTMEYIKADISTLVAGMAASMGFVIAVSGTKGRRFALKHARLMQHQPLSYVGGQASDIEIEANEIKKIKKELYNIISEKTGQTFEKIERDCDRNYWMTSYEAKEYGVIDQVIEKENKENKKNKK